MGDSVTTSSASTIRPEAAVQPQAQPSPATYPGSGYGVGEGEEGSTDETSSSRATPASYTAAINSYARRTQDRHFICGAHYRHLAQFLDPSTAHTSRNGNVLLPQRFHRNRASVSRSTPLSLTPSFEPLIHMRFSSAGQFHKKALSCSSHHHRSGTANSNNAQDFLAAAARPDSGATDFIFLRGFPEPEHLRAVGSRFRVDPEFLRRHLDFFQSTKHFDLPALPSSSRNILQLRIPTVGFRQVAIKPQEVLLGRKNAIEDVNKYLGDLELQGVAGDSIIRKYSVHDETSFTIEQTISCCIHRQKGSWAAIIWLDTGRDLEQGPIGPWINPQTPSTSTPNQYLPVIQHQEKLSLLSEPHNDGSQNAPSNFSAQSAQLLPAQYGAMLDHAVIRADAMYALSELFNFAASSETQFLGFIQGQIDGALRSFKKQEEVSLQTLHHCKRLLDDHIAYLIELIEFIECQGNPKWPRAEAQSHIVVAKESQDMVLLNFKRLLRRGEALASQCSDGANMIVNGAMLEESRRAISQGEKIRRLTVLAFFFVPLTFTSSIFGMNFVEFGQGTLRVWIFFALSIPVLALSAGFCFWDSGFAERVKRLRVHAHSEATVIM